MAIVPQGIVYVCEQTQIPANQVAIILEMLLVEECTIPFIARYRKERTNGLDEVALRKIGELYENYLEIEKRRAYILEALKKQEVLTPEIEKGLLAASTINQLEDIYAPFKAKRKTKGMIAKEAGLEPFAQYMLTTCQSMAEIALEASKYINLEQKITNFEEVLRGACDILAELFAHNLEVKEQLRLLYWREGVLKSSMRKEAKETKDYLKYRDYFEFEQKVSDLKSAQNAHRFLALRRGVTQKVLKVDVIFDEQRALDLISGAFHLGGKLTLQSILLDCAKKANRLSIHPALELEIKSELKQISDEAAIEVFGVNLKNLLLSPYLGAKAVIGLDPGIRTGVKLAVVENTGKFLVDTVIYPHPPKEHVAESAKILDAIIEQFKVDYIAIGNGTYGRETLDFVEKNVEAVKSGKCKATMISESGASIYSASDIAREEFPDKDPTVRGAISIARRFQDPLAELVKIDPKSIGVGQYQHDVNQARLKKSLNAVVEDCVNFVGVDINTASAPLLSYISGIGPTLSKNIVQHREKIGGFKDRQELLKVARLSQKIYQQAAGFLRIYGGKNPLDSTFIHPESYEIIENWAKGKGIKLAELMENQEKRRDLAEDQSIRATLGEFTHTDIVKSLNAQGQDPRSEFKNIEFRKDIKNLTDLKEGEWYPGIVTNITRFGAFVDLGIKENGLVHVSQICDKFVENALDELKVGQEVKAMVLELDLERKRISLTLKKGVDSKVERATRNGPQKSGNNSARPAQSFEQNAPLKNRAFASLQGFKVK